LHALALYTKGLHARPHHGVDKRIVRSRDHDNIARRPATGGCRRLCHKPSQAVTAVNARLVCQLAQSPPHRDLANLELLAQGPLAGEPVSGRPIPLLDALEDLVGELPVERPRSRK